MTEEYKDFIKNVILGWLGIFIINMPTSPGLHFI